MEVETGSMSASIELDAGNVLEDRPADADSAALDRMDLAATVLDDGLRVPGTDFKFGLDPLIGVLPVAGDTVAMALSLYIVVEAVFAGVSLSTVARMLCNVAVDWVAGSVPLVGDRPGDPVDADVQQHPSDSRQGHAREHRLDDDV